MAITVQFSENFPLLTFLLFSTSLKFHSKKNYFLTLLIFHIKMKNHSNSVLMMTFSLYIKFNVMSYLQWYWGKSNE